MKKVAFTSEQLRFLERLISKAVQGLDGKDSLSLAESILDKLYERVSEAESLDEVTIGKIVKYALKPYREQVYPHLYDGDSCFACIEEWKEEVNNRIDATVERFSRS